MHKHEKAYHEDLLDNYTPIFTIFTANKELKQPSRTIIREKLMLYEEENHQKIIKSCYLLQQQLCYTDRYCQGTLKQTLDQGILITSKPNQNVTAYHHLPVNYAIRQYE